MTLLNIRLTGAVSIMAGITTFLGGFVHIVLGRPGGHWLMLIGDILLVFAFTGLFAIQARQTGPTGLGGYVLTILGLLVASAQDFIFLADTHGLESAHDVWMFLYIDVNLILPGTYALLLGALIFGLSTAYARVLPRGSGVLIALAALVNLPANLLPGMTALYALSLMLLMTGLAWAGVSLLARAHSFALAGIEADHEQIARKIHGTPMTQK